MSGVKGRRFGTIVYGPRGVEPGAVPYVDAAGFVQWLAYPEGAALGDYLLATGDDGIPAWLAAAGLGGGSYAYLYLTGVEGGSGDTGLITDGGTGEPITANNPVA